MKNLPAATHGKNKNRFFIFLFAPLLIVAVFTLPERCLASFDILINEIFYDPDGVDTGKEWIEIFNNTENPVDLTGYELNATSGDYFVFPSFILTGKNYVVIYWRTNGTNSATDLYTNSSDFSNMGNTNGWVALFKNSSHNKQNIIDYLEYGKGDQTYEGAATDAGIWTKNDFILDVDEGYSIARKVLGFDNNISGDFEKSLKKDGTPGKENSAEPEPEKEPEEKANYTGKIKINEIFPAPKTKNNGKEFVEIVNLSSESINLSGMRIEDEKNHKVFFPDKIIAPKELFYLEGNFELNNTTSDTAFLIDKDGTKENPIDLVNYTNPKYDYAYAFNGLTWKWTSTETKGAENEFDKILSGKIKTDENIYAGMYANFEVDADKNAQKFIWDFGDGHKSYLETTRHKYEKTGTYKASLKITGNGEDSTEIFTVEVIDYPKSKVEIISLLANPSGLDTGKEVITIKNNSKKKVNLKDWSIATGWKNLANHPITKDFKLKPGESKKLTRKYCLFTLGNEQLKIELRMPNGKVIQKLKYDRKGNAIADDETYEKVNTGWEWLNPQTNAEENNSAENSPLFLENEEVPIPEEIINNISDEEIQASLGKISPDSYWQNKEINRIRLLSYNSKIKMPDSWGKESRVLGTEKIKEAENFYAFTEPRKEKHWTIKLGEGFWNKMNFGINMLLLKFI